MIFKSHVFEEPMLEFGDGGRHRDPRQGLREFGPLQPRSGDVVRVGVIGTEDTVGGFTEFLAETARGIAGLKPGVAVLADAGRALLGAKQYGLAREVLKQAAAAAPSADIQLF